MNNYFAHQELIKRTKLLVTKNYPMTLRLFDRTVGLFYIKRIVQAIIDYQQIQINRKGMADNYGVLTLTHHNSGIKFPIHIEIEYKTGKGKLTPEQIVWRDHCIRMGWWYFLVRDENEFIIEFRDRVNEMIKLGFKL